LKNPKSLIKYEAEVSVDTEKSKHYNETGLFSNRVILYLLLFSEVMIVMMPGLRMPSQKKYGR